MPTLRIGQKEKESIELMKSCANFGAAFATFSLRHFLFFIFTQVLM